MTNTFLQIDEKDLIQNLKLGVLEVLFEKKNGDTRLMHCTLRSSYFKKPYLTEEERQNHANYYAQNEAEPHKIRTLTVWDVDENDWRSFRLDKIMSCQLTAQ